VRGLPGPAVVLDDLEVGHHAHVLALEFVAVDPMRGIKTMTGLRILAAGHAFVQNLRRGHYEIAIDQPARTRLVAAFSQLATAI
jgi:hypothetical protein